MCVWFGLLWQLTDADQELYKNFPLVVSDRWQNEIAETVFEVVNQEADKVESKRRHRPRADEPDEIGMIHCSSRSGWVWFSGSWQCLLAIGSVVELSCDMACRLIVELYLYWELSELPLQHRCSVQDDCMMTVAMATSATTRDSLLSCLSMVQCFSLGAVRKMYLLM